MEYIKKGINFILGIVIGLIILLFAISLGKLIGRESYFIIKDMLNLF